MVRWVSCLLACGCLAQRFPSTEFRKLPPEEASAFLEGFRGARLSSDLCLRFEVTHKPRVGEAAPPVTGTLWAGTLAGGQVLRGEIADADGRPALAFLTLKSPAENKVWVSLRGAPAQEVNGLGSLAPLAPGLLLSPFDLQLPFTHWNPTRYVSTERGRRPMHVFSARQPGFSGEVTFGVDRAYGAILEARVRSEDGKDIRLLVVEDFAKAGDQWVLGTCSVREESTRDADLLRFTDAALGLRLEDALFSEESLREAAKTPKDFKPL